MASGEEQAARLELKTAGGQGKAGRAEILCAGEWETEGLEPLVRQLRALELPEITSLTLDMAAVTRLDSAAAWQVAQQLARWRKAGIEVAVTGLEKEQQALMDRIAELGEIAPLAAPKPHPFLQMVERCGRGAIWFLLQARDLINFMGMTFVVLIGAVLRPWRLHFPAIFTHMERTGLNALPIVGLLSFLIGVVLAYQGADQLSRFGAEIFTVNLVGIGVLREMGILITAIIVAGRSGSAFTAQIGTMQVNEEVDALETIGLDPIEVLVVPRIIALVLVLPLLTFYADILGVLGGAVMSMTVLDITPSQFATQFRNAVELKHFWVGLSKAPIFAFVIALVGCFEGMRVTRSAESVGQQTTRAVVEAVFIVIVLDALFSIFYSEVGI